MAAFFSLSAWSNSPIILSIFKELSKVSPLLFSVKKASPPICVREFRDYDYCERTSLVDSGTGTKKKKKRGKFLHSPSSPLPRSLEHLSPLCIFLSGTLNNGCLFLLYLRILLVLQSTFSRHKPLNVISQNNALLFLFPEPLFAKRKLFYPSPFCLESAYAVPTVEL